MAIELRPDPLEEHSASPEALTAIGGQGIEHSLAGIMGRCVAWTGREEQSRVVWEEWEGRTGRADVIMYSTIIASDFIFSLTCTKTFLWPGSAQTRRGA